MPNGYSNSFFDVLKKTMFILLCLFHGVDFYIKV